MSILAYIERLQKPKRLLMAKHWSEIGEAGALGGMRLMVWIYRRLGQRAFDLVLLPVMAYFFLRRKVARKASLDYLRRVRSFAPGALPSGSLWGLSFRHFLEFGRSLLEKHQAWAGKHPTVAMTEEEHTLLYQAVNDKRGSLIIGSHLGNLEYSRGISRRHPNLVMNVLLHDLHAAKFAALMTQAEPDSRMNLIQVTEFDLSLTLQLKGKIDRGEWVVMAGDRVPVGANRRVVEANFLSFPACFPIGPMVLASVLRCPVYLLHCYKQDNEHILRFESFAEEISLPAGNKDAAIQRYIQQYAAALEEQVVLAPLQWYNFFDFWEQSPAGGAQSAHEQ